MFQKHVHALMPMWHYLFTVCDLSNDQIDRCVLPKLNLYKLRVWNAMMFCMRQSDSEIALKIFSYYMFVLRFAVIACLFFSESLFLFHRSLSHCVRFLSSLLCFSFVSNWFSALHLDTCKKLKIFHLDIRMKAAFIFKKWNGFCLFSQEIYLK